MPIDIIVCIKQVPDPEYFDKITLDSATGTIRRTGIPVITNPADRHAVEEVFAGADTLSTAYILSGGINLIGRYDLILCGNETVDGSTGQVPAQLSEFLGLPHTTHARRIDMIDDRRAVIERVVENGYLRVEMELPAVVAVLKRINTYRLPTVMGIMEASQKEVLELGCSACESLGMNSCDMGLEGSPTRVAEVFESPQRRRVEMLTGEPQEIAKQLVRRLHQLDAL